jgi:hypothetical protein
MFLFSCTKHDRVYRRYTNFAMEAIENVFNGAAGFGKRVTCQISRNGDLIHRVYLVAQLPDLASGKSWVKSVGLALMQDVELEIGGQRIDKHYASWMYIWNELSLPVGKRAGFKHMVGDNIVSGTVGAVSTSSPSAGGVVYVPLEFWFCRNVGLALPLIALQYHEVKVNIDFEQKANLVVGGAGNAPSGDIQYASLWVDYIYLDTDERRRFAQLSHEYLIEQLQFTGDEVISGQTGRIKLNYNHPVKELVWVLPMDTVVNQGTSNAWTNYLLTSGTSTALINANIQLNGQDRFYVRPADYFQLVQPYQHHENIPMSYNGASGNPTSATVASGIFVYSFALKPEEHQPSGSLNFSRIDTAYLNMQLDSSVGGSNTGKARIFAVNYNVLRIMSGMGGLSFSN